MSDDRTRLEMVLDFNIWNVLTEGSLETSKQINLVGCYKTYMIKTREGQICPVPAYKNAKKDRWLK